MADLQKRDHLITPDDLIKMNKLVDVLKAFKGATEILSGETYPTSSLILPILVLLPPQFIMHPFRLLQSVAIAGVHAVW